MARRSAVCAVVLAIVACLGACGDGKSADSPGVVYGCSSQADCLDGYTCTACHLCQKAGEAMICPDASAQDASTKDAVDSGSADSGGADSGDTADASDAPDSTVLPDTTVDVAKDVPPDAGPDALPATCDLVDWTPCPAGFGCYYTSASKTKACLAHGNLGLKAACDPAQYQCGVATLDGKARPLRCDVVDSKCYPTCDCQQPARLPCSTGDTCFCLQGADGQNLPDGAGICAK